MKIKDRIIDSDRPAFIIAELSANHNQNYEVAVESLKAIKRCGADAVKLQTYTPDTITLDSANEYFQIKQGTIWDGKTLYQLYKEAFMPWEWQPKLKALADDLGLILFSTPFDRSAVDFLEKMDVPAYKIASYEITDIPLIEYIAGKNKPVIISTGVGSSADIEEAVMTCRKQGNEQLALLQCTSAYPAKLAEANLKMIPDLAEKFKTVSGLSDHTPGDLVPIAAAALGAKIIEKHFTLSRKTKSLDVSFSLEPDEFKAMIKNIRDVEQALGVVSYELTDRKKQARELSRSLFIVRDMKAGEVFTEDNIRSIRPGYGIHPRHFKEILGKKIKKDAKKGDPLVWELLP